MDSYEENRQTMIAQINENLEVLDNEDLALIIAFMSNIDDYTDEDESDSYDSDDDEYVVDESAMDPNSKEYKKLVSKLSTIALPPISK